MAVAVSSPTAASSPPTAATSPPPRHAHKSAISSVHWLASLLSVTEVAKIQIDRDRAVPESPRSLHLACIVRRDLQAKTRGQTTLL